MRYEKLKNLSSWKETIFSTIAIVLFLLIYNFFPSNHGSGLWPFFQTITKGFFFLVLAPLLFIKLVLKKKPQNFGLNLKNKKKGFTYAALALVFSLILSYILIKYTDFLQFYKLEASVVNNFWIFLLRDLVILNAVLFIFEYFYKGFVLGVYSEKFLYGAIFIQAFFYLTPNIIFSESFSSIVPTAMIILLGGIVAYSTKSFLYSYFYSLAYSIILDSLVIYSLKSGL